MWGSPQDQSRMPPHCPPYGHSHSHSHSHPPHGPQYGPPSARGYEMGGHPIPLTHVHYTPNRDQHLNPPDPYQHRPMYRPPPPPPPPPPPRYDYGFTHPPMYAPQFQPYHQAHSHHYSVHGEGSPTAPVEDIPYAIPVVGGGCTCKKSKCLKLYCQCFSSSTTCGPKCKCQDCHNATQYRDDIDEARQVILERNPSAFELKVYPTAPPPESPVKSGCKCRRSFCLKKYCECFNHGSKCGPSCRCLNCRNQPDSSGDRSMAGPYAQAQTKSVPRITQEFETLQSKEPVADRMAIMAAVAMTELLGRNRTYSDDEPLPESKRLKASEDPDGDRAIVSSSSSSNSSSPEPIRPSPRSSPVVLAFSGNPHSYSSTSPTDPIFHTSSTFDDSSSTPRLAGLPKSLSFRKICSRCGKTRGEHGELGFGHRCVYQECGKCGAGVQMHGSGPMGVLCTLSEQDGALPGASRSFERKILDLALRAELQQKLQQGRGGNHSGGASNRTTAVVGV